MVFGTLCAQQQLLIRDSNGRALPSALVTFKSLTYGISAAAVSDASGMVNIPGRFTESDDRILMKVTYLGYKDFIDTLKDQSFPDVILIVDENMLDDVVVTGQYAPNESEKAVQRVKVIDRQDLDNRAAVNLTDVLQFETNIRISQDVNTGSSANIQGISGQNVKIMVDGVPVIGRMNGNLDLNQINMNDVERIEIVEGPLSVNYGSNALAGVINIITKKSMDSPLRASTNAYYETVGQYNADFQLGLKKGRGQWDLSAGRNYFDGWNKGENFDFLPRSRQADEHRDLQWNSKKQYFGKIRYTRHWKNVSAALYTDYFSENMTDRGSPRQPYLETAFDSEYLTKRLNAGLDVSGKIGGNSHFSAIAGCNLYQRRKLTYFKDLTTLGELLSSNPSDHDTTRFEVTMSRGSLIRNRDNGKSKWELGYEVNRELMIGKRIEAGSAHITDVAVFSTAELHLSRLTAKPGLRMTYNSNYRTEPVPSLNFKYIAGRTTYRLSYARGFRTPSIKELYLDFVDINHDVQGNANLKPETSDNFQASVSGRIGKQKAGFSIELSAFANRLRDMIYLASISGTSYSYINIGRFKSQGLNFTARKKVSHLELSASAVYTGSAAKYESTSEISDVYYSPEASVTSAYTFKNILANLAIYYKYTGGTRSYGIDEVGSVTTFTVASYQVMDITVSKYLFKRILTWSAGIKNLFDVTDVQTSGNSNGIHSGTSGAMPLLRGRSFFTSIKIKLIRAE